MKIYIRAMSEERSAIKSELSKASDQLNMHLIKVMLYPDADCLNHWKGEIYAFLHKVDKLKGKNKWPKADFIKQCISTHNDMIEQYVILVEDEEYELTPRSINIRTLELAIDDYDNWIADELSNHGVVKRSDVYRKIDELVESVN